MIVWLGVGLFVFIVLDEISHLETHVLQFWGSFVSFCSDFSLLCFFFDISGISVLMTDFHDWPSNFHIYPSLIFIPFSYYYTFEISFKDFTVFFTYSTYIYSLRAFIYLFFCFCNNLFWFPAENINNAIRSFSFFPDIFCSFQFFLCVYLWFGQCSHISSFLNLRVLKLKNISQ